MLICGECVMNDFLSDLIITKIYSVSTMYTEQIKKKRVRNNWCLGIKHEGETEYFCNGKKYVSNLNNVVLLPKGSSYEWCCTVPGHFSFIEFECDKECEDIFCFKVTLNVVPPPKVLLNSIVPPSKSTIFFVIANPNPEPFFPNLLFSILLNFSNNFSKSFSLIPIPVSDSFIFKIK